MVRLGECSVLNRGEVPVRGVPIVRVRVSWQAPVVRRARLYLLAGRAV